MKWVTCISLLFLFSSAYSRGVFRREADESEIIKRYKEFGEQEFKGLVLVTFSQYLQKTEYDDLAKFTVEVTDLAKACAADNTGADCNKPLDTIFGEKTCSIANLRDTYGDMADCCAKQDLERFQCLVKHKEEMPNLPALDLKHPDALCTSFEESEIAKAYEAKLEKCCAEADPPACYGKVFEEFEPLVTELQNVVKQNCDLYEQIGEYKFQNVLVIRHTQKAPQMSTPTLVEASRKLGKVATQCCKLSESQRMPCIEGYLTAILNTVCVMHEKNPVSERVTKCCSESFVNKRACFHALTVDDTYVPKELHADTFTFHADICTLPETKQQIKKQTALAELVKHKPTATMDQLKTVMGDFVAFLDKCCKADDKEACFSEEVLELLSF
uniref:Albumin n=1 Tax=Spermophilus dauricus TaxID=99837 RepID=A0A8C9UNW7_SPEDA